MLASSDDWFPSHPERDAYERLLQAYEPPAEEATEAEQKASQKPLHIALVRRAMTNVRRAWELQEERRSMSKLMQMGAIHEDLWERLQRAEQDLKIEIYDVEAEAETYIEGTLHDLGPVCWCRMSRVMSFRGGCM